MGMSSSSTRDPQFRKFLGLNANTPGGVYIADVLRDGPAAKRRGTEKGDVVLAGRSGGRPGRQLSGQRGQARP